MGRSTRQHLKKQAVPRGIGSFGHGHGRPRFEWLVSFATIVKTCNTRIIQREAKKRGEKFTPKLSSSDDSDLLEKGKENPIHKKPSLSSSDIDDDDEEMLDGEVFPLLDPSLIMSMERTVLSAYNQAFQIMMVGAGLMAVGAKDDDTPAHLGIFIFIAGIVYGLVSYWVHYSRLTTLRSGGKISMQSSLYWIGALMLFATIGMSFELYFAIVYPYLTRAQEVSIAGGDALSASASGNATARL